MGDVAETKAEIEKNLKAMLADKLIEPAMRDTAKLLLYAIQFGCGNIDALAWRTKLPRDSFVRPRARRLRESGIWGEDGTVGFETLNGPPMHMNMEFILHCMVAEGLVRRSPGLVEDAPVVDEVPASRSGV